MSFSMYLRFSMAALLSFAVQTKTYSFEKEVAVDKKPAWIKEKKADQGFSIDSTVSYGGYYFLLVDVQENIPDQTLFCHYIVKLINSEGVQKASDISLDFDPSYQTLRFHEITLLRDGVKTNELLTHKINVIQRESDMESFLYDGSLTAYVNLKDTREGDIIEYSYSLKGYNPVYKGNYFKTFSLDFGDPVKEIYRRIIAPKNRQLYFKYPSGKSEPLIREDNSRREYIWEKRNVPAHSYDNNVPTWFSNNIRVEVSTLSKWSELCSLLLPNYAVSRPEMEKLRKEAGQLFAKFSGDTLCREIIRFVQDDIRYLGVESGIDAFRPNPPAEVLERRFADCKAKSLLLCSLLRLSDIDVCPVLVSTFRIKSKDEDLPAPGIFNHVIVRINNKGKVYYVDPTIAGQGGEGQGISVPYYGYGLLLKEGSDSLVVITNNNESDTKISDYYKADSVGGRVKFRVVTEYTGSYADENRQWFKRQSKDEIVKTYLKFYSKNYPLIKVASPLSYKDDREKNIFTVEENYTIDSLWVPMEGNKLKMEIGALVISSVTSIPSSPARSMPYAITYPQDLKEDIYIDLPDDWVVTPTTTIMTDSVFSFSLVSEYANRRLHYQYRYKTLRDYQSGVNFQDFYSKHSKIEDCLFHSISHTVNGAGNSKKSFFTVFLFVLFMAASVVLAVRVFRYYNLPYSGAKSIEIGGWLILVAIGLGLSTIITVFNIFSDSVIFSQAYWTQLVHRSENFSLFCIAGIEMAFYGLLLVYLVLLQFLFYKKRNTLPKLMVILYAVIAIFYVAETIFVSTSYKNIIDEEIRRKVYSGLYRSIIGAAIWIPYFLVSSRVKETFTNVSKQYVQKQELKI